MEFHKISIKYDDVSQDMFNWCLVNIGVGSTLRTYLLDKKDDLMWCFTVLHISGEVYIEFQFRQKDDATWFQLAGS